MKNYTSIKWILPVITATTILHSTTRIPVLAQDHTVDVETTINDSIYDTETDIQVTFSDEDLNEMYSLDEFAQIFSINGDSTIEENFAAEHSVSIAPYSTNSIKIAQFYGNAGVAVGACQLTYQTAIVGGRPQFVYDTCYLGNFTHYGNWSLVESHFNFTGDKITVYATFTNGWAVDNAIAVFYPY